MGKPTQRKADKKRARDARERQRERVKSEERRKADKYKSEFPGFVFHPDDANSKFVSVVKQAVGTLRLDDTSTFHPQVVLLFKELRRHGADILRAPGQEQTMLGLMSLLGNTVFGRIPQDQLLSYLPLHDVQFVLRGPNFHFHFRSLCSEKGPNGTVYYSKHRPTITVEGKPYIVAFSKHAIERACERVHPNWRTYLGLGDAFALFEQCLDYDICELHGGQLAITSFEFSSPMFWLWHAMGDIVGRPLDPHKKWAFRIGYYPIALEGKFAKAITMLPPGFGKTPERSALLAARIPPDERDRLLKTAESLDAKSLIESNGIEVLKWFHDHGVPQVLERHLKYASSWE